ncbi:uncharacterized protein LOC141878299 isoform X2 [Acropora palmata]|uniref:uncharacterized protein LOC141878299 isoform X2 n=1 Tax=Acropora palmata TaxID=6131 RepID=UPI003DA13D00
MKLGLIAIVIIFAELFDAYDHNCDFENGLCPGWYQSFTDDFDWTRHSGPTWSTITGPSSGHGGYGFYMYIETSYPRSYGDKAKLLLSPPSSIIGKFSCLKFYYHMYGATINRLNVFNGNSTVFTKSGQQGNMWMYAEVTVFVQNNITFEGISGSSYTGDIAIDDVSLMEGICTGCKEELKDPFGLLHITYSANFSRDCTWTIGNSRISKPVAIVSIGEVQFGYCGGYIKVFDGSRAQIFTRGGCQKNHNSKTFLEIPFQESQNVTFQVLLYNNLSYARVGYGILKNGLDSAFPLLGWNVTYENKTSSSLQLRWMDINNWLSGGVRFFVVIANSSYNNVPIRKLVPPNITSAEITGLDPYREYNVSVVAIDGYGSPFQSTVLQAKTDEGAVCGMRPTSSTLIVGGTVAPINSWPWQALLRTRDGRQFCGGSLIKPEWVLTATHCVVGKFPSSIQVTLGAHYLSTATTVGTEQYFDVAQIIQHENYNLPKRWSNDVALLKLSRPAVLRNGVGLVCLSDVQFQRPLNKTTKSCWTTGWGTLFWRGSQPKELMQVDLPLVSTQNCSLLYANYDPSTMICAGTRQGGTGACNGDSGGPLVCEFKGKWYLEGVTSWGGVPCASPSKPTVYADVRKLKSWIAAKITGVPVLRGAASCDFESGLCPGWYQSKTDDFDWTRRLGPTPSYLTGPSSGHGGYGFYMYIETSYPRSYGDKAKLLFSPPSSVIGKFSCLKFYYHMYGGSINQLNVFNGKRSVLTRSGQQGDRWLYAQVTINVQNTIIFEGISGFSYTGDIAIDDVSLMDGICMGCTKTLNDSFGQLNVTYNETFSPDCIWTIGSSGISEPVAIVSVEEVQLGSCSDNINVFDGTGAQIFTRTGCQKNHTSNTFLEIAFQESQNVTIQASLSNKQSYARVSYGILKNGLDSATLLVGWDVTYENKTSNSLHLQWMDINHWLSGGVRFFVVNVKSSYSSFPVRKLLPPNVTSAEITGLEPYQEYNVSVVAIDGYGSPFRCILRQAKTDEGVPSGAPSIFVTNVTSTSVTVQWNPLPSQYHNGRLLGYRVFFRKMANYSFPVDANSVVVYNSNWATLKNLDPGQLYEISVTAFTSKGDGPRSDSYSVTTACTLSVNNSIGLIDVAYRDPLHCLWTIGNVGITNAVAVFVIQRIIISSCSEHFKIFDGNHTAKYDRSGRLSIANERMVEVPFLSPAEINVSISLTRHGSTVKAWYLVLGSSLYLAPVLPGWNLTISNETFSSFSVQWTNLTALLGSQVQHFIVLLKSSKNNNGITVHKIVNGREDKTEMTGLLSSSQYTIEVFGIDQMGQPYRTLEVHAGTLTAVCGMRPTSSTLIVGGTVAPINSWPWQALLRTRDGRQFCGGSLIKPEWVLTATHCVVGKSPSNIQVTLGAHYFSTASVVGTEQYFNVTQIIQHENYASPKQWSNDVALLKLSRPAVLRNGVGLVCLSDDQFQRPFNNKSCWTSGWGTLVWLGSQPKELMQVDLPLVTPQTCSSIYPLNYDANTMICAGRSQGGKGVCHGDSGGPLVCEFNGKWYLEGVTSWVGLPCGAANKPAVYADVRNLKSWIIGKMTGVPVPGVTNCGSVVNNTLKSPGFPSNYPRNTICVYQIPIPCDKELVIYFNYFYLQQHWYCWYDYLRITDGSSRVIGTFCGQQTGRSVLVNDTVAVLYFRADGSVQFNGFQLSFSFFPRGVATVPPFTTPRPTTRPTPGCGSVKNNALRSPGYPSNYPKNMNCVYRVYIPFDQELLISFIYFNLERHSRCIWDYLRITNDKNQIVGTYCGYQVGKRVVVVGSAAVLRFRSDSLVQKGGFHLSFTFHQVNTTYSPRTTHVVTPTARPNTTSTPGCGSVRNNTLRSPGYPSNYPGNLRCVYRVNIPSGKDLKIHFHYFHLENHSSCDYDYLKITNDANYVIGTFCGQQSGALVTVTGSYALLTFHTDRVEEKTGFELFFSYGGFPGCVDEIPANVCSALARLNLCSTLYNITLKYCSKTCGFCKGITPKSSGKPPEAASNEAVMLTVGGLDINKWDRMEDDFKTEVARTATQYCNTEQAKCVTSSARSRRRRSSDIVFSPNMVHILPGYPKQSPKDPKNAMLAFYLSLPPEVSQGSVVSKEILTSVIKSNMTSIGGSMNLSIVSVDAFESSPSAAFQSSGDRSTKSEANRTVIVGGSVGGSLFVVLIAFLLVVYKKNRRPQVGLGSTADSNVVKSNDRVVCTTVDPNLEKRVCVDESFASNTNEVTPQSKSLDPSTDQDHPNSTVTHF